MYSFQGLKSDIKSHLERNKTIYLMLLLCFFIGLIVGLLISVSKTSFLGLLNVKDKTFINLINGNISPMNLFWKCFAEFLLPLFVVFVFSLNYYLNFCNYLLLIYQSTLFFLSNIAIIQSYSFLGFLKVFFVVIPINLLFFVLLIFWIATCSNRVRLAKKRNVFASVFDYDFITKLFICFGMSLLLALLVGFVFPILLKTAIFLIY